MDDFLGVMSTEQFKRNIKKRIVVRFISEETDFEGNEKLELGVGVGPLHDLMSTLLDKFVLPRLSVLFEDGSTDATLFNFTEEDMYSEMFAAGQVSGI